MGNSSERASLPWPWGGQRPSLNYFIRAFCAFVLMLVFMRPWFNEYDPYKCRSMVESGVWRGRDWVVPGCTMISHDRDQLKACIGPAKRKILIIGDTQLQGLYWGFLQRFDSKLKFPVFEGEDFQWEKDNLEIQYVYDPLLNSSVLHSTLEAFRDRSPTRPLMTIVGAGNFAIENGTSTTYPLDVRSLASVAHENQHPPRLGSSLSYESGPGDILLFAPAEAPLTVRPQADRYTPLNMQLDKLAQSGLIEVPASFTAMTKDHGEMYVNNQLGLKDTVHRRRAELLLNLRCNAVVASQGQFPNKATCCAKWTGPNWIQVTFLMMAFGILPAVCFLDWRRSFLSDKTRPVVHGFASFCGVIGLQYITDRTHWFEQTQRAGFDMWNHKFMIGMFFLVGALTLRRSKLAVKPTPENPKPNQPFLPRDQTDEWKGWMQALIIVYHYNSGNTFPRYWVLIRLCVGAYLFLTGFGHTVFFLQKKDFSLKRFANVMIRTNLLPCTLAYVMRTRWLLYYYMPLATFWFAVVYATMALGSRWNDNTPAFIGKVVASCVAVELFVRTRWLPVGIVNILSIVFKISFDADGFFQHRVGQDRYVVYVGMLLAPFYIWLKDALIPDKRQDRLSIVARKLFPWLQYVVVALSAVAMYGWWNWLYTRVLTGGPFAFPPWQPYVDFIPILAFTVLRNAHPLLRNFHSTFFAFLGRYSGEMYVMQDHLWLSADQESVLRTGLFYGNETVRGDRWRDLLLLTPVYLIGCSIIGDSTGVIANWFISDGTAAKPKPKPRPTPQSEAEMGLLNGHENGSAETKQEKEEIVAPRAVRRAWMTSVSLWPSNLSYRILLLFTWMWFLNLTYT